MGYFWFNVIHNHTFLKDEESFISILSEASNDKGFISCHGKVIPPERDNILRRLITLFQMGQYLREMIYFRLVRTGRGENQIKCRYLNSASDQSRFKRDLKCIYDLMTLVKVRRISGD